MILLVEGIRQKTPNEIALTILLSGFTIMFLIVTVALEPFGRYAKHSYCNRFINPLLFVSYRQLSEDYFLQSELPEWTEH